MTLAQAPTSRPLGAAPPQRRLHLAPPVNGDVGRLADAYVPHPSFHRFAVEHGMVTDREGISVLDALRQAHLDFVVRLVPVHGQVPTPAGPMMLPWGTFRGTVRMDGDGSYTPLSVVRSGYSVCQNTDAFAFGQDLINEHGTNVVAASAYGTPIGVRAFVAMRIPGTAAHGLDRDHDLYAVLSTAHDGNGAVNARVVAWDRASGGEVWAPIAPQDWSFRHRGDIAGKLSQATRTMDLVRAWATSYRRFSWTMAAEPFTVQGMAQLAADLMPTPTDVGARGAQAWDERRAALINLFRNAPHHEGTKLAALQAVNAWVDQQSTTRGGTQGDLRRAHRILSRPQQPLKLAAMRWLTHH